MDKDYIEMMGDMFTNAIAKGRQRQSDPFANLPKNHFGAILADPPWHFGIWADWPRKNGQNPTRIWECNRKPDYATLKEDELAALPIIDLAAKDCVLFLWVAWPTLEQSLRLVKHWGFQFKTCAFSWMKADPYRLWADDKTPFAGLGYWTRANTEPCLLATRGKPKRQAKNIRQGIIAPRREHSRKPDGIHQRIERLVAGPYLELFARQSRPGWTTWGAERTKFDR